MLLGNVNYFTVCTIVPYSPGYKLLLYGQMVLYDIALRVLPTLQLLLKKDKVSWCSRC